MTVMAVEELVMNLLFGEVEVVSEGIMVVVVVVVGGGRRVRRRSRVHEVGPRLEATHGSGGAVVGAGGFLRRVEGSQPPPFLRLRVSYLRRVTAPRPPPHAAVPHSSSAASAGGGAVFSQHPLGGDGGGALLVVVVGCGNGSHAVEAPQCFLHVCLKDRMK